MCKIYGVVITYNVDSEINDVVKSVLNDVTKLIIVDNGSNEGTISLLKKLNIQDKIEVIYNKKNLGIARALNIGIGKSIEEGAEWILTLDHDSKVDGNMIKKMIGYYSISTEQEKDSIGILAPEIIDISINKLLNKVEYINGAKDVKHVIQSGALIKSNIFKEIGYFKEELFIYFVDIEFCYRVRANNKKIIQIDGAKLFHEEGKKERRKFLGIEFTYDNYSGFAIYYITRNAIYMLKKYRKYEFIKRIVYDFIKILLADTKKIKFFFEGIKDGILNKYGDKFN